MDAPLDNRQIDVYELTIINKKMQDNKKTTSLESYEAPKCEIIEIQNEGVLCGSDYSATHRGFEDSDEVIW